VITVNDKRCRVCNNKKGKPVHHFFHPRREYPKQTLKIITCNVCHIAYHNYFDNNCKGKQTFCDGCLFAPVCCYFKNPRL